MNAQQPYKKVLVTGSGGFIFSNFIRKAIYERQPYKFVSVDKVTKSTVLNTIYINKDHSFYFGDVSDAHLMNVIFEFERPDIVIHGAAESFMNPALKDPSAFITSNIFGTQVIIDACIKWGVEKLIYISDDEVYGQLKNEGAASWSESASLNPGNPYSASKAAGELLVKAAHNSYGLNYNITRSSNNYGPRQTNERLIPKAIKCIMDGEKIPLYGQGLQIRDWTHVYDNCSALLTVLNSGALNETYNISANQEFTNIEVIQKICNAMGRGHDLVSFIKELPGHDFRHSTNSAKIRELGWKPNYKFNNGIVETVEWYQKNSWFLK